LIFKQFIQEDLACASYLVGAAGVGAIVDPKLEIDDYLESARYLGLRIEHVLETHNHADHVSGHGRLAAATGATIHIHRLAHPSYEHEPFDDGWELELGDLTIRALHTPGHRPEHTAFALIDRSRSADPWAVLTGDTLFVGDVARPDLAIDRTEGAKDIFRSLQEKLLVLPPHVEIWPGHLGGSMCGSAAMSPKIASTLAFERSHNELLQLADEASFVAESLRRIGPQPPNFESIVALNRGDLDADDVPARSLSPRQLRRRVEAGALLVDIRTSLQFDDAHIPGATQVTILEPGFASKLAWLAAPEQEIVFVGRDDADGEIAVRRAQAVGLRRLGGYLGGGMTTWREEGGAVERSRRITLEELKEHFDAGDVQILDVREGSEVEEGRIAGSLATPWHSIDAVPAGLDPDRPIAAVCGTGKRAGVAASLLQRFGASDVVHVSQGGFAQWKANGWPMAREEDR
jgi:glyoxylase-like metal-dependent hydrolase (beta-lactamase superfamily II)/rhodanese-related sulfurtransferase